MSTPSQDSQTFSSQKALLRIAMGANILAWIVLVFALVDFTSNIRQIVQSWPLNLPPAVFDQIGVWANFLKTYLVDLFYFFVLLGLSQLIYLGLDLYYGQDEVSEGPETGEAAPAAAG
jgi:hypothetical protein